MRGPPERVLSGCRSSERSAVARDGRVRGLLLRREMARPAEAMELCAPNVRTTMQEPGTPRADKAPPSRGEAAEPPSTSPTPPVEVVVC